MNSHSKINGLDAVRALAAIGVFIHHAEEFKKYAHIDSIGHLNSIHALGGTSVTAFFVLSGFLLSLLLMQEKEQTQTIQVRFFYLRRVLRIWPLYFMTLLLYKCVLPNLHLDIIEVLQQGTITQNYDAITGITLPNWLEWLALIFMQPHILLSLGVVFNPAHIWSIGVEETFYLFWPFIILQTSHYFKTYFKVILIYLALLTGSFIFLIFATQHPNIHNTYTTVSKFLFSFLYFERISCMAIGALAAYLFYFDKQSILRRIQ